MFPILCFLFTILLLYCRCSNVSGSSTRSRFPLFTSTWIAYSCIIFFPFVCPLTYMCTHNHSRNTTSLESRSLNASLTLSTAHILTYSASHYPLCFPPPIIFNIPHCHVQIGTEQSWGRGEATHASVSRKHRYWTFYSKLHLYVSVISIYTIQHISIRTVNALFSFLNAIYIIQLLSHAVSSVCVTANIW